MYFSDFLVNNHISGPSQTGSPTPLIQSRAPAILLSGLFLEYPPCCPTSEALFMLLLMFNLASPAHAHLLKFYPPSNSISDASFFMTQHWLMKQVWILLPLTPPRTPHLYCRMEEGSPFIEIHHQVRKVLPVPLRRWKEDGVDALSSFLMQFDERGSMLGGGSIFSGKSRHRRESRAPWRHIFLSPQFRCGLTLSRISKDMTFAPGWWCLCKLSLCLWWEAFSFLFFKFLLIPHPKVKILPSLLTDWYRFSWTYFCTYNSIILLWHK